jgi:two-component system, NtrC family, sensor histidine kinase HydH
MWRVTHHVHLPTLALGVLWIVHSLATTMYVPWQNNRQRTALESRLAAIEAAQRLQENVFRLSSNGMNGASLEDDSDFVRRIGNDVEQLKQQTIDRESQALLERLQNRLQHRPLTTSLASELPLLIEDCQSLIRREERLLLDVVDQRSRTDVVVMVVRAVLLVLGLMVGIGLAMWMTRGLKRSLAQISVTLRSAEGDLSTELGRIDVVSQSAPGELKSLESQVQNVVRNIHRVGEELRQAREDIVRAERLAAVGEVAAGVAHEIRNPLTSVKLVVQRAAERRPIHSLSENQVQVLLEEVSRIEHTVQGLLDFARPDKPQRTRCPLAPIIKRTLTLLEGRLHRQQVELIVHEEDASPWVNVDPPQIQQVLVNLIINALDAMPAGGRIEVRQFVSAETDEVVVEIEDDGPGISADIIDRLFEPFATTRSTGSGLGLAISRRLIEDQGGSLQAANSAAGGAVFAIRLPVDRCPSGAPRLPTSGSEVSPLP